MEETACWGEGKGELWPVVESAFIALVLALALALAIYKSKESKES